MKTKDIDALIRALIEKGQQGVAGVISGKTNAATTTTTSATTASTTGTTSPTAADEVAFISGLTDTGRLAGKAFATWNGNNPATYSTVSHAFKWGGSTAGTAGGTLSYYFDPRSNWTATEKAAFASGFSLWSAVANVSFTQAASQSGANVTIKRGSDGGAYEASSYYAHNVGTSVLSPPTPGSYISIDTRVDGFGDLGSFSANGGYCMMTVLHEEGHFLGLGHAGAYDGAVDEKTQQFSAYDSRMYSVMSYIDPDLNAKYSAANPVQGTNWAYNSPQTWMPLDIQAIQRLYGVAASTPLSGGQVFGYGTNITGALKPYFDFTQNKAPVVTLWDKGTNNTLNLSGCTTACKVNLNPGTYSSFLGMTNNLAIAGNTTIDHVVGGSGNDYLIGNSVADSMLGGAGNDTFVLSVTPTLIDGGTGSNTLVVAANAKIALTNSNLKNVQGVSVGAGASLDMSKVSTSQSITSLSTAGAASSIVGSAGADTIRCGAGGDTITGGARNDCLYGGAGADTFNDMMAGFGRDTVYNANLSMDHFHFSSGFAADTSWAHLHFAASGADTLVYGDAGASGDSLLLKGIGVSTAESHRGAFSIGATSQVARA